MMDREGETTAKSDLGLIKQRQRPRRMCFLSFTRLSAGEDILFAKDEW